MTVRETDTLRPRCLARLVVGETGDVFHFICRKLALASRSTVANGRTALYPSHTEKLAYHVPMRTTACVEIFSPSCGRICATSFIHMCLYFSFATRQRAFCPALRLMQSERCKIAKRSQTPAWKPDSFGPANHLPGIA